MVKHWMTSHPEFGERPLFKFAVIGRYKDCLSRQVAEAIRILTTKDRILNSKNEYLDNCIPRITIDESKLERMKREKAEEQQEMENSIKLESFRLKKKTKKRTATATSVDELKETKRPVEPATKKLRRDLTDELLDEINLGEWLEKNEKLCQRVGELKNRMEQEKLEVLRKMEKLRQEEILKKLSCQVLSERPRIESASAVLKYQTPKRNTFEKRCSVGKILEFESSRQVEANLETGDLLARHSITNVGSELKFAHTMPGQSEEQILVFTTTETLPNTVIRSRREQENESESRTKDIGTLVDGLS